MAGHYRFLSEEALTFKGKCTNTVGSTTSVVVPALSGYTDDFFTPVGGGAQSYYMIVMVNANSAGNAPQGQIRAITDYVSATGTFTTAAFGATVEDGDIVMVVSSLIYAAGGGDIAAILAMLTDVHNTDLPAVLGVANSINADKLAYSGTVTTATSTTEFAATGLVGTTGNDYFRGWYVYVLWDSGGLGVAPQGEWKPVSDYVMLTGTFTHAAFTARLAVGDRVVLIHPSIANNIEAPLFATLGITGPVIWCDFTNGVDTNPGTFAAPVKWPHTAISKHTDNNNGAVVFMPGNYNLNEAAAGYGAFVQTIRNLTLIFMGGPSPKDGGELSCSFRRYTTTLGTLVATGPCLDVQEATRFVGHSEWFTDHATYPGVRLNDTPAGGEDGGFGDVTGCRFVGWGLMTVGLQVMGGNYNAVHGNIFEELTKGVEFVGGVGNPAYNQFYDNDFRGCTYDFYCSTQPTNNDIYNNRAVNKAGRSHTNFYHGGALYGTSNSIYNNTMDLTRAGISDVSLATLAAANNLIWGNIYSDTSDDIATGLALDNLDHLLLLDGATQKYPEQCATDSILAKLIAKGDPAVPSTYDCTTDSLEALSDAVAANAAKLARATCSSTYWSTSAIVTLPATGAAADQAFPNVVIPTAANGGIPTGATVLSVFGILMIGSRHNSNAAANKTTNAQNLQVQNSAAGTYTTFHVMPDDSLPTAAGGTSPTGDGPGQVVMGSVDVKAEVSANGTYNLRWASAGVDVASLILYDVQVGLVVTYSLG